MTEAFFIGTYAGLSMLKLIFVLSILLTPCISFSMDSDSDQGERLLSDGEGYDSERERNILKEKDDISKKIRKELINNKNIDGTIAELKRFGGSPLTWTMENNFPLFEELLVAGANPNGITKRGGVDITPLMNASAHFPAAVPLLLVHGADVNQTTIDDERKYTALSQALSQICFHWKRLEKVFPDTYETVRLLLDDGADHRTGGIWIFFKESLQRSSVYSLLEQREKVLLTIVAALRNVKKNNQKKALPIEMCKHIVSYYFKFPGHNIH
jgi:hypothetical protein